MKRVLAVVAAMSIAALLCEAYWRLVHTRGFGPTTNPRYVERDDELGWRYRPGASLRHATSSFDVAIEIAANGFRDATPATVADRPIVTLGDSYTFGWGVPERDAFPARLEELTGVVVQNLSVSGYDTGQEVLLYERDGVPLEPRAVVVNVCGNDVEEVWRRRTYGRWKPYFHLGRYEPSDAVSPPREAWLPRISHLARSLAKSREHKNRKILGPPEVDEGRRKVVGLLAGLARRAEARGTRALVMHEGEAWLAEGLQAAGVACLDLEPALAEARRAAPVRFELDDHWTSHGHAAVAAALAARLDELGALD